MPRNPGFTLVELMVATSVLGICACIALPSMGGLVERQRTSAAMNALMTHMALARIAAITYRTPAVLCPSTTGDACDAGTDWSGGWMLFLDANANRQRDTDEDIVRVEADPTSRHLAITSTSGRTTLRYLPDGRAAGTNLTLSICNRRAELLGQVVVNGMGRPRSDRPAIPTPCPT